MSIGGGPSGGLDSGFLAGTRWTDKSFSATRSRVGINQKPDFDFTEIGLLFPQDDPSELIYILDQMDHRKKFNTAIKMHVHFVQDSTDIPNFKFSYRVYNNSDVIPATFTTIQTDDGTGPAFTYPGSGSIMQIVPFSEIALATPERISSHIEGTFFRDDNRVTGDVLFKYLDYHYQMDSDGSRQEYVK